MLDYQSLRVGLVLASIVSACALSCSTRAQSLQQSVEGKATISTPRMSDGHPDLSGYWIPIRGALAQPATVPIYKPEFAAKVKDLGHRSGYTDPTWNCAQPGVPRVGPPYKIVQRPGEVVFIYTDFGITYVGMVPRVISTDGGKIAEGYDPSFYGNSVAHWEGDTLVVEGQNFVTSTWMAPGGYIHSEQMKVVERLSRDGNRLHYQATITDPGVLTAPWAKTPVELIPTDVPLIETPACVPNSGWAPNTRDPDSVLEQQFNDAKDKEAGQAGKP